MTTPDDDAFVGHHLLENNLVSREAFLESLFQLTQERKSGKPRPLGVVLVSRGLITEDELAKILASRVEDAGATRLNEAAVGNLLLASGLVSPENVEECLSLQAELRRNGKPAPPLGELVVSRGYATEAQVNRVLAYQKKLSFVCSACGIKVTAAPPPPGNRYRCKKCNGFLEAEAPAAPAAAPAALALSEGKRGEDTQGEIDRAVAAYLKQKQLVRRDQLRESQRLQMEFARYGLVVPLLDLLRRAGALSWQQQQQIQTMDFAKIVKDPDWKRQSIPGYRLLQRVASGGFAAIWTAGALFGSGKVAVKVLHPERAKDPRAVARFEWEAMLLRKFDCPHIVRGLDHGFERGTHYLVMEYVEGRSLGQALSESGAFPVRLALQLSRQIAEALRYLHGEGYLHRDVKPDNALMDFNGKVKLCDLGFAVPIPKHDLEGQRKLTAVGTAGYMSPEVARGESDVKVGADIYSLGIILYALLTGHEPFEGVSSEEVAADQLETGMPVPNLMVVQAPPPVIQFLKRMMHPDRTRRYPSMVDAITALDKLLAE